MKTGMMYLRLVLLLTICCIFFHPASAQEKYFKITDSGKYYFFSDASIQQNKIVNGDNTYVRPITARTFFLQGMKDNLFPNSLTFTDFAKMSITQKQNLLDSLQQDFDWSKYRVNDEEEKPVVAEETPNTVKPDFSADTTYSIANLAFDKESTTIAGEMVSGMGRKQPFMIYPVPARSSDQNFRWIIEWLEPDLFLKKKGYKNLNLPEEEIYEELKKQGIDLATLNSLIK